jgi:hypothetical protein
MGAESITEVTSMTDHPDFVRSRVLASVTALLALGLACSASLPPAATATRAPANPARPEAPPTVGGCQVFPSDNIWNLPVDTLPLDPRSSSYVGAIGANTGLHMDFGQGFWPENSTSPIGIPYMVVPGSQPKVNVSFQWDDESDPGPYPIPPNPLIEGGPDSTGDRHILLVDEDACRLYELFAAYQDPNTGTWSAGSGAIFDLGSNALRPDTWTSADAAGLPILPGLVRYEEVAAGEITHAVRFTAEPTQGSYVWPARHEASSAGLPYPPLGQRFRLKASYDISGFSPAAQVILRALKKYGMILADNGGDWYISGVPSKGWDNGVLHELDVVQGADFEAVWVKGHMVDWDSGQTRTPHALFLPGVVR